MAFTNPRTWLAGETITAAIMNQHVRDQFLASAAAILTAAGDMLYATAANTLARLPKGTARQVLRMNAGATAPEWWLPSAGHILGAVGNDQHVEGGSVGFSGAADGATSSVAFAKAFASAPKVVVSMENGPSAYNAGVVVVNLTAAGFDMRFDNAGGGGSCTAHWIAIGSD